MSPATWLEEARSKAWEVYKETPQPDRVAHIWRYTDPAIFQLPEEQLGERSSRSERGSQRLLNVQHPAGSSSAGVRISDLREAAAELPELVQPLLGTAVSAQAGKLEALNLARWQEGLLIHVLRGQTIEEPLQLSVEIQQAPFNAFRLLVVVEEGASVTIVDDYRGGRSSNGAIHVNVGVEIFAKPESQVRYITLQELSRQAVFHFALRTHAERDARVDSILVSLGTAVTKADVGTVLQGKGAQSESLAIIIGDQKQHYDHHSVHDHRADHTLSNFDFKTVLSGRAHSVYTGVIRIDRQASHCEAYQENRNLMLSETAKADSIPELEIMNNEVRCTHGATMGPIEPEHIFYLMSRGISRPEATRIIVEGFVEKTLAKAPADLQQRLREQVHRRLGEN